MFMVGRYLRFLAYARTRHQVHSPYVFSLISEVIRPGAVPAVCAVVEVLREKALRSREVIVKTDLGSGAESVRPATYPATIGRLARTSTLPPYRAARLFRLARYLQATRVLELGTALGFTTAYLAKAVPDARIVTLEGCHAVSGAAWKIFSYLMLDHIEQMEGEFDLTLPAALEKLGSTDLVFIDGNHREEPTVRYFETCLPYAAAGSVFVIDDIHSSPGMEKAWEHMRNHEKVTVSIDLFHMGWLLLREELSRQHFILRYP